MNAFSHFNEQGRAQMVNVSNKEETDRTATAQANVRLSSELYHAIHSNHIKKRRSPFRCSSCWNYGREENT